VSTFFSLSEPKRRVFPLAPPLPLLYVHPSPPDR